jgi:hypothetical protein
LVLNLTRMTKSAHHGNGARQQVATSPHFCTSSSWIDLSDH